MSTYRELLLTHSPTWWSRFSEPSGTSFADEIGSLDGTWFNTPTLNVTGPITGDGGKAVTLTAASTEYGTVPDNAAVDLGDVFSVIVWFKRASIGTYQDLFRKGAGGAAILYFNNIDQLVLGAAAVADICNTAAITDTSSWHMAVAVKNGASDAIYIDGASARTGGAGGTCANNSTDLNIGRDDTGTEYFDGSIAEVAMLPGVVLSGAQAAALYAERATAGGPVWTTPADTVSMSTTPDLKFTSPSSAVKQHFQLQLDTVNTFNSGNLRTYDSSTVQTNWTYYNGASWVAIPSDGLPIAYAGNEVDYTVTSALSGATWYRRVRAGTLA